MAIKADIKKKLGDFSLHVKLESDCRRIGILGASGCGKSMTLKCIAGIEKPDEGQIVIDGRTMYDSAAKCNWKPQKRNVGYLFQNYALFPTMSVKANIAAGLKCGKEEKAEKVERMLHRFQLDGLGDRLPGELSGGQQQRVALARIMVYEPDMIMLDEPFSALDAFLKERLQQEMQELLAEYKGNVILVSHSRDEIYQLCDELLIMDQGKDICYGKTKEIFANPQHREAARLTGCKNLVPVKRFDAHTLEIPQWGTTLSLQREIAEDVSYVGLRAHDFVPAWEEERPANSIAVQVNSIARLQFERKYFLAAEQEGAEEICWFVQRNDWPLYDEKGLPRWLVIPEEKLLLLKD